MNIINTLNTFRVAAFGGLLALSLVAVPTPTIAQSAIPVAVGGGVDVTQGFWLVAKELGLDEKYGLDITVKTFEAGSLALQAVAGGDIVAAGTSGGLPTLRGKSKGANYVGVASALKAPLMSCAVATENIKVPKDLEGKTVGFMTGSSSEFWWFGYTEFHKLTNVKTLNMSPPETISALRGGQIDAFFNWQPWCGRAEEIVSGAHVISWGGDNNLQPYADAMISFNADFVKNSPDTALRLLRAVDEAVAWIPKNAEKAAEIMAKRFRSDVAESTRNIKNIEWGLRLDSELRELLYEEARWMTGKEMIKVPDSKALVDSYLHLGLLRQIDPDRVK